MELLEQIEPIIDDISSEANDLRDILDDLKTYAATVKNEKNQKFLLDIISQLKDIAEDIDDCASAVYSIAEDADVVKEKDERLTDEVNSLHAVLRDYLVGTTDWREQHYIKSHYGVDITA